RKSVSPSPLAPIAKRVHQRGNPHPPPRDAKKTADRGDEKAKKSSETPRAHPAGVNKHEPRVRPRLDNHPDSDRQQVYQNDPLEWPGRKPVRLSGSEKGASEGRPNQNTGQGQFLSRPRLLPPTAKERHSDCEEAHDPIHAACG